MARMWKYLLLLIQLGLVTAKRSSESQSSEFDSSEEIFLKPPVILSTPQGDVEGIRQRTLGGETIYSFRGIRYVEAPVGALRFKDPIPAKKWAGVYDATRDKPACPQPAPFPTAEDCLFINVYSRKLPKKGRNPKYPVIVYIHPGSFTSLTGNSDYVGPQYLLDRKVLFVTFNYRLAALGFLSTGDEHATGNYGMKDQVQALRWVKDNIAAFGGDPNCVTLAGYSVGGVAASAHLTSPMSKGLFHRVMIMSGSSHGNVIMETNQIDLAKHQARSVGCPDDNNANMVNCLRNVSADALGNSLVKMRVLEKNPQFNWQYVLEPDYGQERFLLENPLISIQKGNITDVPVMTGVTRDELIALAETIVTNPTWVEAYNRDMYKIFPYAFNYEPGTTTSDAITSELKKFYFNDQAVNAYSLEALGQLYSDSYAGFPVDRGAQLLSKYLKSPVYYYEFTYKGALSNYQPSSFNNKYVAHLDDQLYVFWNSLDFPRFNKTNPDARMVKKLTSLYANFAHSGNPTPYISKKLDYVVWTPFNEQYKQVLDIGGVLQMKTDLNSVRYAKWRELFPLPAVQ